jgi:hypothetical protein
MRKRAAWGILAAAVIATAGCSAQDDSGAPAAGASAGTPSAPASSSAADPAASAALGQAAAALGNTSFKVTMTSGKGFQLNGVMDAPGGKGSAEVKSVGTNTELTVSTRLVGQDLYVQIPGLTKAGTWTRINMSRLPEGADLGLRPGQIDPANTAKLVSATTDVQQSDPRSFTGSLDLTKVAGLSGISQVTIDQYGSAAQKVPFTAGLDDQGRLSAMTIQLPPVNGQQVAPLEILYTDYGTTVGDLTPAASSVVDAPDNVYTTLGGK